MKNIKSEIYGLTSSDAAHKLQEDIRNILSEQSRRVTIFQLLRETFTQDKPIGLTSWLGIFGIVVELVLLFIFAICVDTSRTTSIYFEICIVGGLATVVVLFSLREKWLKNNEVERLIEKLLYQDGSKLSLWNTENVVFPSLTMPECASVSLIATYRDGVIVNFPCNLLVEDDVIILGPSRSAPANCEKLSNDDVDEIPAIVLEAGETYHPHEDNQEEKGVVHPRALFRVTEAPIRNIINCYCMGSKKRRPAIMTDYACAAVRFVEIYLMLPIFFFTILVNIVRWVVFKETWNDFIVMTFMYQSYVILPLLPLLYPITWLLTKYYGSCRVQYLAENEDDRISLMPVLRRCCDVVLRNDPEHLPRTMDLVSTLGSITTFCCVDKEGILCHPNPIPEKMFFFKPPSRQSKNVGNKPDAGTEHLIIDPGNEDLKNVLVNAPTMSNCIEVISLSPDPESNNRVQFDKLDWEIYQSSLRPMGVNILLNSPCSCPTRVLRENDFIRNLSLSANTRVVATDSCCLCSLARYLGLKDERWKAYETKQRRITYHPVNDTLSLGADDIFLSIVKEKHVPQMTSSVVNAGRYGVSQVFTQGMGDMVLDTCTDLWNGEDICPLNDIDRSKALNFFRRMNITRPCYTFAYRPIFDEKAMMEDKRLSKVRFYNEGTRGENDIDFDELLQTVNVDQFTFSDGYLKKQIFLGMLTTTHALIEDLIGIIEQLDVAGIRFVHFSYENELLSRVFCERLGLETGWNCHISLAENSESTIADEDDDGELEEDGGDMKESSISLQSVTDRLLGTGPGEEVGEGQEGVSSSMNISANVLVDIKHVDDDVIKESDDVIDDEDDDDDTADLEPYFLWNRSKLPKGIQNMRTHLSEIDDVPLLVPLFTDCNAVAVQEMMGIMQEYGDVVCCIGSSLNAMNHGIFTQSDISISMEPLSFLQCPLQRHRRDNDDVTDEAVGHNWIQNDGPLALSASLNTVTCSLRIQRKGRFPIGPILNEARRFTKNCRNAFLFTLTSLLFLSLVQVCACLVMLPPPLTGLNIMWLSFVIVPLLAVGLIASPADKKLMKTLTGKRRANVKIHQDVFVGYIRQYLPVVLLNCLFVVLVLFPWLLFAFCKVEGNSRWFTGWKAKNLTNSSSSFTWKNFEDGSFYVTHDVITFYMTLSLVTTSFAFVDRLHFAWSNSSVRNKTWALAVLIGFVLEFLRTSISYQLWRSKHQHIQAGIGRIPAVVYVTVFLWLIVMLALGELLKRRYIRDFKRFQKRQRLKFGTKLGMNSPV